MPYLRRLFLVPPDFEDALSAYLWSAGTLGVRSDAAPDGRVLLEAWFAPEAPAVEVDWPGAELTAEEVVPDTDWLSESGRSGAARSATMVVRRQLSGSKSARISALERPPSRSWRVRDRSMSARNPG